MSEKKESSLTISVREEKSEEVVLEIRMSKDDYEEYLAEPGSEEEAIEKGLGRKHYCVTCHGKDQNGNHPQTTEKAYSSALAHLQGAPKCMAITGNPGNSVRRGKC